MQPQILDSGSLEVLSPLEGRIFGEGTFGGDGSGGGAAFQSLMAAVVAALVNNQLPIPVQMVHPGGNATGDGEGAALSAASLAGGAPGGWLDQDGPIIEQAGMPLLGQAATAASTGATGKEIPRFMQAVFSTADSDTLRTQAAEATAETAGVSSHGTASLPAPPNLSGDAVETLQMVTGPRPADRPAVVAAAPPPGGQSAVVPQTTDEGPALPRFSTGTEGDTRDPQPALPGPLGAPLAATVAVQSNAEPAQAKAPSPVQQIADQVQVTVAQDETSATIRLHPEALGRVRIRLHMQDGQLHLSIEAEKPQTGRLLEGRMVELRQNLEGGGIRLGDLAVVAGGRSSHGIGHEALQREAVQPLRAAQMEMGHNNANPQHGHQPSAAFAGQHGNHQQRGDADGYGQHATPEGIEGVGGSSPEPRSAGGERTGWRHRLAGVDYYA